MSFKIQLKPFTMLSASEVVSLATEADSNFERASKAIERLRKDEERQRAAIADRWKRVNVSGADRSRLSGEELSAALHEIRANAAAELDGYVQRAAHLMRAADDQRPMYEGAQQVLERAHLGEARRSEYVHQLRHAGPIGLARMGQLAVGTKNTALAAAVLTVLDRMPSSQRSVSPAELADAMELAEWRKVSEALRVVQNRGQATINAVRAFRVLKGGALGAGLADAFARLEEDPGALAEPDEA